MDKKINYSIEGELNFARAPELSKNIRAFIAKNDATLLDLAGVKSSDNSGVALLVDLASYAKKQGKEIKFINPSQQLCALMAAVKVDDLLPLDR